MLSFSATETEAGELGQGRGGETWHRSRRCRATRDCVARLMAKSGDCGVLVADQRAGVDRAAAHRRPRMRCPRSFARPAVDGAAGHERHRDRAGAVRGVPAQVLPGHVSGLRRPQRAPGRMPERGDARASGGRIRVAGARAAGGRGQSPDAGPRSDCGWPRSFAGASWAARGAGVARGARVRFPDGKWRI